MKDVPEVASRTDTQIVEPGFEVLVADNLHKAYGQRRVLQGLSFELRAGRVLGLLGPNGAGKTTAIRILTTTLEPDTGYFIVDGVSSEFPEKIRNRIGVLPESLGFPKQITGLEFLVYFGQLYGQSHSYAKSHALELLEEVGLQQRAKSLLGTYSRGMRQRLGIARALINNPAVAFLDEPALGLDPRGQQELLGLVRRIAYEHQAGVILCSHQLTEVEGICDDVVILNLGQMVARGSVAEVIGRVQRNILLGEGLRVQVPATAVAEAKQILEGMPNVMKVTTTGEAEGWLQVVLMNPTNGDARKKYRINNKLLNALIRAKIPILSFESASGRLQDVFLHLTEDVIE